MNINHLLPIVVYDKPFDTFDGIEKVTSGYMSRHVKILLQQVKSGLRGDSETVEIQYDVALFSYNKLLEIFFSSDLTRGTGGGYENHHINIKQLFSTLMIIKKNSLRLYEQLKIRLMLIRQLQQKMYPHSNFTKPKTITKILSRKSRALCRRNKKYAKNTKISNNIYT